MSQFIQKVEHFIQGKRLLLPDATYLVALSGGADSVALLLTLHELGYQIEACHCNFQLRGEESYRDEQFCVDLCLRLGIPLHRIHFDTFTYAQLHKESIELAARNLRYRYFAQLKEDIGAAGICVAHHQDDSVETVLINLIRGTGVQGLTGIAAKNGDILRPLLCVDRQDILGYLSERGQDYVTDSTNLVDDVVRNKIRLNIIPLLKEINPAVCKNIAATAHYLEEANKILLDYHSTKREDDSSHRDDSISNNRNAEKEENLLNDRGYALNDRGCALNDRGYTQISKKEVMQSASPEYSLFMKLSQYGFAGKAISEILVSTDSIGKTWESTTHQLLIDREYYLVRTKEEADAKETFKPLRLPETGCYVFTPSASSQSITAPSSIQKASASSQGKAKIKLSESERDVSFKPSKERFVVTLDADKVKFPLTLRLTEQGDFFHPFGMKGKKLVSDYLTDKKRNLFEKQSQLVLADKDGNIIWLVGERTSEDCRISDETSKILRIELIHEEE